ncbi:MAG: GCN5-related N-acetyltransferase [Acidobacteria bacterium]|nr:GCN5-related N-acetyltransferase [Acidobacteriota bacterium]
MKRQDDALFLKGKRLYLRPVGRADIPLFLKWGNDQELRLLSSERYLPVDEIQADEWLVGLHKQTDRLSLIICLNNGRAIGLVGLHKIDWKNRLAMTECIIGEKQFWSKGYGSEAKMLLLHHAFQTLNLRKIHATVYEFNKRSVAHNKKCGYKVEGVQRQHVFANGEYHNQVLMAVFREDWLPIWKSFLKTGKM